ncbi:MAG: ABC transporter ATP-binding protein [Hyphomicrobiales bacterium]|nr:ABC transporter ATP-binding protein [Hyphomicrobiales bacterium]
MRGRTRGPLLQHGERTGGDVTDNPVILDVAGLAKHFTLRGPFGRVRRVVRAIDGVSFQVRRGETLGIVGESGSGKSTIGKCLVGIHEPDAGDLLFNDSSLLGLARRDRRRVARQLQYVYQDPGASLDPRWKVGRLLEEPLVIHADHGAAERRELVRAILGAVKLPDAFLDRYPHELSGGQQRRVGLARILTLNPSLIILDEPTSGLDVSVQAAVINLFKEMKAAFDLTYIFISHDLSVVRILCDRVAVMYAGRIVEIGDVEQVFEDPRHPYTRMLLNAVPRIGRPGARREIGGAGDIPAGEEVAGAGCPFQPRCAERLPRCAVDEPLPENLADGRGVACHAVAAP